MDSNNFYINSLKSYFKFSLDLSNSNTESYQKYLQTIHKVIKDIDMMILIVKHKLEEDEEETTKTNNSGMAVIAKNKLLNYSESIPNYLW